MRRKIVQIVAFSVFAAPIVGPAAVVELTHSGVALAAQSSCPSGMSYHSGASYTQDEKHLTPIRIGSGGCYDHVSVSGTFPTSTKWWQMKQCCNGAAISVDDGPTALVNSYTYNAGVDGIRTWNASAVTMVGVHEVYTRDDCISDITHGDLVIRDSLFDGCHTGISWRSTGQKNKKPFTIDIQDSMFYIQPEPGSSSGGSCDQWVVNGKANGPMWKMDTVQSGVNLKNVIIRQDLGNHECKDVWPSGSYSNVTFVWTDSKPYPGKLPAGVTMSHDVSVWDNAKAAWLAAHNGSSATKASTARR